MEIQKKLEVLELAEKLGNVSEAAKISGVSRDTIYRHRTLVREGGITALKKQGEFKYMKIFRKSLSKQISMIVTFGFLTLATTIHSKKVLSDNTGILVQKDIVHMLVGKTIHVGNPRSKIYFTSLSTATILLLEGDNYGESEDVSWTVNKDSQFCFIASLINGIESCYQIERLNSGNFRVSVERGEWRSKFNLPKNKVIEGKDF